MIPPSEPAGPGAPARRARRKGPLLAKALAVGAVGALLLTGCASSAEPGDTTTPPAATPTLPAAGTESATPAPQVTFAYQPPESPCPAVSALESLPHADERPYALVNSYLGEQDDYILETCTIAREDIDDDAGEGELILEDRAVVGGRTRLYPDAADTIWPHIDQELPIHSDDLDDWVAATDSPIDQSPWQEGCGPDTPCADGEEPTVQVHAVVTYLDGRVGNLEFRISVSYRAERLPADVERRNAAILREFVLAMVAGRERVDR